MIPPKLAQTFPPEIRERGEAYYLGGAVHVTHIESPKLTAVVRGTQRCDVQLDVANGNATLTCTCPHAAEFGVCEHQWAVLRATDVDGTLASLLGVDGQPPMLLPQWQRVLEAARLKMVVAPPRTDVLPAATWPSDQRLVYFADLEASWQSPGIVIELATERELPDGTWAPAKRYAGDAATWLAAPDAEDRRIAEMLLGAGRVRAAQTPDAAAPVVVPIPTGGFVIPPRSFATTLDAIIATGRLRTKSAKPELDGRALHVDAGPAWRFVLRAQRDTAGEYALTGMLTRPDDAIPLAAPAVVHGAGYLLMNDTLAAFEHSGAFPLVAELRAVPVLAIGRDPSAALERLYAMPHLPPLELPDEIAVVDTPLVPVPMLAVGQDVVAWRPGPPMASLALTFRYGAATVASLAPTPAMFDAVTRVLHRRNERAEAEARARLIELGGREEWNYQSRVNALVLPRTKVAAIVAQLMREEWIVLVDGRTYRSPGAITATVRSGIDWFDLGGSVMYGEVSVPLATLLEAKRRGEELVALSDGTVGLLPTEWLAQLGPVLASGEFVDGVTRFRRSQLALLDALLETLPAVDVDDTFEKARAELAAFERVTPADPPATFRATLREYQREGLGWLHFLRRFSLGGCLADDMGLGKTIQVLALLDARRVEGEGPSLVVVPRSLVFNWMREAERFAPALRLLDFSGVGRNVKSITPKKVDLVITTYGTLRRDIANLRKVPFDYVILDEAQAIKNPATAAAKACRLLQARHRVALSGTPIENRLEELWSLLEFLNPGMLGASARFSTLARLAAPAEPGDDESSSRAVLAKALKPVLLRRRKEDVAKDLPPRVEQTLEVVLEPKQRAFYTEILKQYRESLMDRIERDGMQKSRMHILEALLRLRQAACHPVLVDSSKHDLPCAKLDALIPALQEVAAEGHKALVFSQFTSFLSIVRNRLDEDGVRYEYLDGKTRDREARVDRFQNDPDCPVFLISLKAGGHGLNLTAADYVYLLDPWWNPAVEAQAIDRAHRIGQVRQVMATRLVARDTIEAKILQLQENKRALADAILSGESDALASIGREELEMLLS